MTFMKKDGGFMYGLIAIIFCFLICQLCIVSLSYARTDMHSNSPLAQKFGTEPGAYELLIRVSKPILDPGDKVQFEVYLSGYGLVESACVYIAPSWSVFSVDDSKIAAADTAPQPWDLLGTLVSFEKGFIFDAQGRYQISTECKTPPPGSKAPINMDMKIRPDTLPGIHSVHFVLKYYNGETWNTKSTSVNFTVRNFYQRHETLVWAVGGIAAFLTIISISCPLFRLLLPKAIECPWK